MPTAGSARAIDGADLTVLKSLWEGVLADLRRRKGQIDAEIRGYPTPIPRCDAQFNHLHEQQVRLARELDRVGALSEERPAWTDYVAMIERFIGSEPYTDEPEERELRSTLRTRLSALGNLHSKRT